MPTQHSTRNVFLFSACQALSMSGAVLVFAVVGLAGKMLAPTPELATLPLGVQFLSMMVGTVPASLAMGRIGRRLGFTLGQVIGLAGAALSAWAVVEGAFWVFVAAAVPIGVHGAFYQFLRFAAAETARPEFRAKAISYVMAGGVVAAFLGPELAKRTADLLAPATFAGAYVALMGLCLLNLLVLQGVRMPRPARLGASGSGRPLALIARQPVFVVAVMAAMVGYGVMNLVMVATPLAMVGCGFTFADSAEVIRWHVLGMFVPSFFTGHLIARFGVLRVIAAGGGLIVAAVAVNVAGLAFGNFMVALTLLGVGWNFMFVGGTALLAEAYAAEERAKAQALNDLLVFGTTAVTSFASGAVQTALGWQAVNLVSLLPVIVTLAGVAWLLRVRAATAA
ncbi:MAG: MFS transporter [Alphaproteobacteria bacterium]|nr:MFS transporter [Alphaproteobacteria bacterium]